MFKLSLAQKAGLCWGLIATLPVLSYGQSGYPTNGRPYSVVGSLRGDQVYPALSLTSAGGYIVWEDNATDGSGLGISAAALDSTLSMNGNLFRVNQRTGADQENPQVSVFPGGGAAFFWQGGLESYQHIYGRFLSSSNTWLGPDVVVSTPTNSFQINPASATLTNGNVIVLWGSYNQFSASSMQDVYGQMFSPNADKIGSEFLVNQFTSYNQRTPAVAALAGGGFVAVWVSEQQRVQADTSGNDILSGTYPSVDIYGRVFTASGAPASDEFLVNSNLNACANPRVAAGTDGGFIVVWAQKDSVVQANGWDIFARSFASSSPSSGGAIQRINTTIYGDQFLPQISALGTNYFVAWKSLGPQTIFGQFLNADASPNGGEFQVAANPAIKTMGPALASDNYGQFLAVWTRFTGFAYGIDLSGQRYSGPAAGTAPTLASYDAPASDPFAVDPTIPQPPQLPVLPGPTGPLPPPPIPGGPTNGMHGVYTGLFYDTNGVVPVSSGYFTASVTARGTYSARVTLGKHSYAFSGRLDSSGSASKTIDRGGASSLMTVQFLVGGEQLFGTIKTTGWLSEIFAYLQQPLAKAAPGLAGAGKFTMIIPPPDGNSPNSPAGYSYGTVQVDAAGNVRWAGTLADGTKVTQKSSVSKLGIWPLYSSLYGGSGSIASWVQFTTQAGSDLSGAVLWQKLSGVPGKTYTAGFTNSVAAAGSSYTAPKGGARALNFTAGTVSFTGSGVALTNSISLDSHNRISNLAGSRLSLSITPSSGLFHGTVLNSATGKNLVLQGVVLQDTTNGFGLFLNSGQSGSITLTPTP